MFSKLINRAGDAEDGEYWTDGRDKHQEHTNGWKWWHIVLALVLLFPYICIFALFGMVSELDDKSSKKVYESVATMQLSNAGSAPSVGSAVSLTDSGKAQLGGGTSIYKNIVDDLSFKCPSYLDVDAVHEDIYLVSYSDKSTSEATLVAVQVTDSTPNKGETVSTLASPYYIYETVVLSQSSGIFVSICQDFNPDTEEAFIVAGSVSSTSFEINQGSPTNYTTLYSVNPSIARLDDNTFAISYFSSVKPYQVMTRYGVVDPSSLQVTLSESISYADNDDIGIYATIVGMSANQYLLMFYNAYNSESGSYVASGPLNSIVATVPSDAVAKNGELATPSLAATQELSNVVVDIYFQAASISNATAVLAYSDANSNSGIRAQALTLESTGESIILGASWLVTSGEALVASENSTISDLDVATISTNGDFLVLYTDASNGGAATAITGTVTLAGELTPTSPSFVLTTASSTSSGDSSGDDLAGETFVWGAVSAGNKTPWGSRVAVLTSITDTVCSDVTARTSFNFMEVMPKPLGIVDAKQGSSSNVVVSGQAGPVEGSSLLTGMQYYTNTMGALVPAGVYYGRSVTASSGANFGTVDQNYIYDADTDTIVTFDSLVGMAISPSQMFVNPNNPAA